MRCFLVVLCLWSTSVLAQPASTTSTLPTVNGSITITLGNTFQTITTVPAVPVGSAGRRSLTIQNNNATDSCWLYIGSGAATKANSILLLAGQGYTRYFPYIPADQLQATCATSADTLYVDTQ